MGCLPRGAEPPGEPDQDRIADGTRIPSTRRCRKSARIPYRTVRFLINITSSRAKRDRPGPVILERTGIRERRHAGLPRISRARLKPRNQTVGWRCSSAASPETTDRNAELPGVRIQWRGGWETVECTPDPVAALRQQRHFGPERDGGAGEPLRAPRDIHAWMEGTMHATNYAGFAWKARN